MAADHRRRSRHAGGLVVAQAEGGHRVKLRWAYLILLLLATWPVWGWLGSRVAADASEALRLIVPLAIAGYVLYGQHREVRRPWLLPAILLAVYAAAFHFVPPLARGVLAMSVLASALSAVYLGRRMHLELWGLLLFALPVVPSLQFFAGYPLRALVAQLAAPLLRLTGHNVLPQGACLHWGNALIVIDAPCSGVRMLWVGGVLVFGLASVLRLSPWRTTLAALGALVCIIIGNTLRTAALFFPEAGLIEVPTWMHDAIGITAFLPVVMGIAWWTFRLRGKAETPAATPRTWSTPGTATLLAVALIAGLVPLLQLPAKAPSTAHFPGWPTTFEGAALHSLPLTARERQFQEGFPGKIGLFAAGERQLVLRWVTADTRMLHPAADCFRGVGYRVTPLPLYVDAQGRQWGAFRAEDDTHRLLVRELITDANGHSWSDPSSWYWSASLHHTPAPWWAVTVVEEQ